MSEFVNTLEKKGLDVVVATDDFMERKRVY